MELYTDQTVEKKTYAAAPLPKGEYENCIFKQCDFSETDLSEILFVDTTFIDCNLSLARLARTVFRDVLFRECKMMGLHFENCDPFGVSFTFERCVLNHSSFYLTKIKKTIFSDVQLQQVDFTECDLTGAVFKNCDFMRAAFDRTILEKADLRTSYNYSIDPTINRIKKAKFSLSSIGGLLDKYDIEIDNQ